jgi:hypothetical protein
MGVEDFQGDIEDGPDLVEEDDVDSGLSEQSRGINHFPNSAVSLRASSSYNTTRRTGLTEPELVHASATLRRRKLERGKSISGAYLKKFVHQ